MTTPAVKTSTIARRTLAVVALIIPFLVVLASWEQWRSQLPLEVASHWSGLGAADASLPTRIVYMTALLATGFAALGGVLITVIGNVSARARIISVVIFGLIAGVGMTSWLIPAYLTVQAGVPADAVLGWWVVPLILLPAYGFIPALLLPRPSRGIRKDRQRTSRLK